MTPFELECGQPPLTSLAYTLGQYGISATTPQAFADKFQNSIANARAVLQQHIDRERDTVNARRKDTTYAAGDMVLIKRDKRAMAHKLEPIWEGPYPVVRTLERDGQPQNAVIVRLPGNRHDSINVSKLKRHNMRRQHHVNGVIAGHKVDAATDGCEEIRYRIGGRWCSLHDAVIDAGKWSAILEYHAKHPPAPHDHLISS